MWRSWSTSPHLGCGACVKRAQVRILSSRQVSKYVKQTNRWPGSKCIIGGRHDLKVRVLLLPQRYKFGDINLETYPSWWRDKFAKLADRFKSMRWFEPICLRNLLLKNMKCLNEMFIWLFMWYIQNFLVIYRKLRQKNTESLAWGRLQRK